MRISEFTNTRIRNIIRDNKGIMIEVEDAEDNKTGYRRVPLTFSAKYLDEWLSVHPYADEITFDGFILDGKHTGILISKSDKCKICNNILKNFDMMVSLFMNPIIIIYQIM